MSNSKNVDEKYKIYIEDKEGLPENLMDEIPLYVHYNIGSRGVNESSMRVYSNGDVYRYSDTKMKIENDLPKRIKAPFMWRFEARVSAEGMEVLRVLLKTEFKTLKSPESNDESKDRGTHFRCANFQDGYKEVILPAGPLDDDFNAIQNLENSIYHNLEY